MIQANILNLSPLSIDSASIGIQLDFSYFSYFKQRMETALQNSKKKPLSVTIRKMATFDTISFSKVFKVKNSSLLEDRSEGL